MCIFLYLLYLKQNMIKIMTKLLDVTVLENIFCIFKETYCYCRIFGK